MGARGQTHPSTKCTDAEAFGCSDLIKRCLTAGLRGDFSARGGLRAVQMPRTSALMLCASERQWGQETRAGLDLGRGLRQGCVAICWENKH